MKKGTEIPLLDYLSHLFHVEDELHLQETFPNEQLFSRECDITLVCEYCKLLGY